MKHHTRHNSLVWTMVLGLTLCFAQALPSAAEPPSDPYADAIDDTTTGMIVMPSAALGAPDGRAATVGGVGDQHFVLDMGANEEGTGNLVVHYLGLTSAAAPTIVFLDANRQVLATHALPMLDTTAGRHQLTVPYAATLPPYRYVRLSTTMGMYNLDAIAATTYRPDGVVNLSEGFSRRGR